MAPCAATAPMVSMEKASSLIQDVQPLHRASFQKTGQLWSRKVWHWWFNDIYQVLLVDFPWCRALINIHKQKTNHAAIDTVIWQSIVQKYCRYDANSRYTIQLKRQSIILITCHRGWNPPGILPKKTEKMTWENDLHKQSAIARYHDSQSCVDVCVMLSSWDFCLGSF